MPTASILAALTAMILAVLLSGSCHVDEAECSNGTCVRARSEL
jgi:hypothetical protein